MKKDLIELLKNNIWENEHKLAEFKYNIRKKGMLPILKDGNLIIYKISRKQEFYELSSYYRDNMIDIYNKIVLNDQKFKSDLCKSSYLPFFNNMLNYRPSTTEEIYEKFHLNDKQIREDFIKENAQEMEIHIPIDDITYTKSYRKEDIQEILKRISQNYVTCIFKRPSKVSAIINFIGIKNYFNLDFIASQVVQFLYSKMVDFSNGTNIISEEQMEIEKMRFTDKEQSLSDDEKIKILKNIKDVFNIECVCCEEFSKISDLQLESILGTNSREMIINFAKHNTNILYNKDFSPIYNKIISSNSKTLTKK